MNDAFQIVPGCLFFFARTEDQLPHCSSIDLPGCVKHTLAKTLSDGFLHPLEHQNFVTDFVSVDQQHVRITRCNPTSYRTFS